MSKVSLYRAWASVIPIVLLISATVDAAEKTDASEPIAATAQAIEGVSLMKVIDAVASRTQKRYLVDPRVKGIVPQEGLDLRKISYRELQAILRLHGFAAVEVGGAINVVPDANVRYMPLPVVDKDVSGLSEDDIVIKLIGTGKLDAARLVPLLRPMLPQFAHLAADSEINSLLVVARFANIKTIEAVVRALEKQPVSSRPPVSGSETRPVN